MPGTIDLRQSEPLEGTVDAAPLTVTASELWDSDSDHVAGKVRTACLETGFFCIQADTQLQTVIDTTLARMQAFFEIDDNDPRKLAVCQDDSRRGWCPRFSEPAYQPGTISSLEAFDIGLDDIGHTGESGCWPDVDGFRAAASQCWSALNRSGDRVLELLAQAAGIDTGFFRSRCDSRALNSMRLLHYAADNPLPDKRNVGIAAHTDFECITLLYQDSPGLEIRTVDGRWQEAEAGDGRLIVMLDDMIERWTNGRFKATGHRVRETDATRFSIVLFVAANDNQTIAPLEAFISPSNPSHYPPVSQAQHLEAEVRRASDNAECIKREAAASDSQAASGAS